LAEIVYRRPSILRDIPHAGHVVIQADAGTGKTHTIQHLVADLILFAPCTIDQLLVVTFTEKATAELHGRVRRMIEDIASGAADATPSADDEAVHLSEADRLRLYSALSGLASAPIFTIHAFCQRVLTEFAFHSGVRFDPEVIDARLGFHRAFRARLRERFAVDFALSELLDEWLKERPVNQLEDLLFEAHQRRYLESEPTAAREPAGQNLATRMVERCLPEVEQRLYRYKREQGLMDYDDMLLWVWRALEGPGGRAMVAAIRDRYRYALVDEFQDTDDLQWRIFKRVFVESGGANRLFVVGDPKQAIYGFRGADVHTYLKARDALVGGGACLIPLVKNFRSTSDLVEALNLILDQKAPAPLFTGAIAYDHPAQCGRPELRAVGAAGRPAVPVTLLRYEPSGGRPGSASRTRAAVGRHIAASLHRMLFEKEHQLRIEEPGGAARQVEPKDVFVLTRSHQESLEIGNYLREAHVPFAFYKLDGLFQTREAHDVLDVLRAVEQPHARSRRLKAWASPFFGVALRELALMGEVPPAHPLNERLYEWKALAEAQRFPELFDRLLHQSGLVERELFLSDSERALTNYLHIFELMLEQAVTRRLALPDLIALLEDYIAKRSFPPGMEGNVQRLESERSAVQVMTIHMSKGLEADVIAIFGGMHRKAGRGEFAVYHVGDDRRFAIGKESIELVKGRLAAEEREEDQRLLYVALTRARAKLYLPLFPKGSTGRALNGLYSSLNKRLADMVEAFGDRGRPRGRVAELFAIESVGAHGGAARPEPHPARPLSEWSPPKEMLRERAEVEQTFANLRRAHAPLVMRSYTSIKALGGAEQWDVTDEDFKGDIEAPAEDLDLAGGSRVGLFLHEAIEGLDMGSFGVSPELARWKERDDVKALFRAAMDRRGVRDERWLERGCEVVFNALTAPIAIAGGREIGPLYGCRGVREMEFVYPIPEAGRSMASRGAGAWTVERGYLKGFVDLVFEDRGLMYFADWKSDLLRSYDADAIAGHVARHYELQARIYSVGVIRLLRIQSEAEYERRFGGLLYVFLRGVRRVEGAPAEGVYFHRPRWAEICRYETELASL
jgi:exodeoxyribonuclease V beta subunit